MYELVKLNKVCISPHIHVCLMFSPKKGLKRLQENYERKMYN